MTGFIVMIKKSLLNNRQIKFIAFALFVVIVVMINSCKNSGLLDSPPAFIQFTTGPQNNEVLFVDKVAFGWKGASSDYTFRYRILSIDGENFPSTYLDWTVFSKTMEVSLNNLDEGKFRIEVEGRSGSLTETIKREFSIDAVQGPSLLFFKTQTTLRVGLQDSIGIWMEDVDSLAAYSVVIVFDKSKVEFMGVRPGLYITQQKFKQIIVPDFADPDILNFVNTTGRIEIYTALLTDLGSYPNKSISGSGRILNLVFRGKARGTSGIEITSLSLKNPSRASIQFKPPKDGVIEVK
jgi:hypothetical protein